MGYRKVLSRNNQWTVLIKNIQHSTIANWMEDGVTGPVANVFWMLFSGVLGSCWSFWSGPNCYGAPHPKYNQDAYVKTHC